MPTKIGLEILRGAPTAFNTRKLLDHKSVHLRNITLAILDTRTIVADQWISHGNDLASVGWISQHLLISAHGRVEANLTNGISRGTDREPGKDSSVFKG